MVKYICKCLRCKIFTNALFGKGEVMGLEQPAIADFRRTMQTMVQVYQSKRRSRFLPIIAVKTILKSMIFIVMTDLRGLTSIVRILSE
jgi:hypothetical protein